VTNYEASILSILEIAMKAQKPLILLTFLGWHLFCQDNTTQRTPNGVLFALVAEMRSVLHDLLYEPTSAIGGMSGE
jgi:hypothetical protein